MDKKIACIVLVGPGCVNCPTSNFCKQDSCPFEGSRGYFEVTGGETFKVFAVETEKADETKAALVAEGYKIQE